MVKKDYPVKKYPTIGACGLDCGLCPRYYTAGPSRCPGCAGIGFFSKHPTCSFITCCVRKKNLEVCGECPDFPCNKFKTASEYLSLKESSSYPSVIKILPNLGFIKNHGFRLFMVRQNERIKLLETMIKNYDDGRSRSFYCKATAFLEITVIKDSIDQVIKRIRTGEISQEDVKTKAKILKSILNAYLLQEKIIPREE